MQVILTIALLCIIAMTAEGKKVKPFLCRQINGGKTPWHQPYVKDCKTHCYYFQNKDGLTYAGCAPNQDFCSEPCPDNQDKSWWPKNWNQTNCKDRVNRGADSGYKFIKSGVDDFNNFNQKVGAGFCCNADKCNDIGQNCLVTDANGEGLGAYNRYFDKGGKKLTVCYRKSPPGGKTVRGFMPKCPYEIKEANEEKVDSEGTVYCCDGQSINKFFIFENRSKPKGYGDKRQAFLDALKAKPGDPDMCNYDGGAAWAIKPNIIIVIALAILSSRIML